MRDSFEEKDVDKDVDYDNEPVHTKRYETKDVADVITKDLDFFVNAESLNLFKRFNLSTDFLNNHPSTWDTDEHYVAALNCITNLKVVNDCAERMVKLMKDFNGELTKDEEQLQYILQIVQKHRQDYGTIK